MSGNESNSPTSDIDDKNAVSSQDFKVSETLESRTKSSSNIEEDGESDSTDHRIGKNKVPTCKCSDQEFEQQKEAEKGSTLSSQVIKLKEEIKKHKILLEALAPVPGLDRNVLEAVLLEGDAMNHDLRDVKIVHQAKQLRQLKQLIQKEQRLAHNALNSIKLMEVEKVKMERELEAAHLQIKKTKFRVESLTLRNGSEVISSNQAEMSPRVSSKRTNSPHAANQRKSSTWRSKYDDLKIHNDKLQSDMKKLHRALTQELGVDASMPLMELLEMYGPNQSTGSVIGEGGKRTRSQQIIVLKAKVKELKRKFALERRRAPSISSNMEATNLYEKPGGSIDAKVGSELVKQHEHKQKQLDQLISDNEQYRIRVEQLIGKLKASQSRTHILEQERKENKAKIQVLAEKSGTDDKLIDALQAQVSLWKQKTQKAKCVHTDGNNIIGTSTILPSLNTSHSTSPRGQKSRNHSRSHHSSTAEVSIKQVEMAIPAIPVSETARYRQLHVENERLLCVIRELKKQHVKTYITQSPGSATESRIPVCELTLNISTSFHNLL
ncbi:hypothetical protein ABG067_005480 [Albugo candida]